MLDGVVIDFLIVNLPFAPGRYRRNNRPSVAGAAIDGHLVLHRVRFLFAGIELALFYAALRAVDALFCPIKKGGSHLRASS